MELMIPPGRLDRPVDHETDHVLGRCRDRGGYVPSAADFSAAKIDVFAASILSAVVGAARATN